ncbi:MAG TPA: dTDP-4-dehydrorhamnose 3,5-epimerase family protein [Acidimicrobiales bacterium]|nr:dTDP-4-dehydrorhamnose 3,5-epimerase family protein [Acidimicrobiales bacterium]
MAALEGARRLKVLELSIPGLFVLESPVWSDERGFFREWYQGKDLEASGVTFAIHQANLSTSKRGVVRGLHYSLAPGGQAKLVTCAYGELDDVIVDVRVGSPTFGHVEVVHLAADDERSVLVPASAAHGFCVTSELGVLSYLLSSPFNAAMELEINPFDETLNVPWPLLGEPIMSEKDVAAPSLAQRQAANELPIYVDGAP